MSWAYSFFANPPKIDDLVHMIPNILKMTDLCIVTDATGSMGAFLEAISDTLPQYLNIAHLTGAFSRIGVLAYQDYSDKYETRWSGWYTSLRDLSKFADGLRPAGGGDAPEAAKTAIVELLRHVENPTIVIWYADAPPHHKTNRASYSNQGLELRKLGEANWDWVGLCGRLATAGVRVFPIINTQDFKTASFYMWMAKQTGGQALLTNQTNAHTISSITINLILALLGSSHTFTNVQELCYAGADGVAPATDENTSSWLPSPDKTIKPLLVELIKPVVPTAPAIAKDLRALIKVFRTDEAYQATVFAVFDELLTPRHIESLTYNAIFGTFWREICKRRKDPRRDAALVKINKALAALSPATLTTVKTWLDASYDQEEEILELVAAAVASAPLDPILVCTPATAIATPTRAQEILEIAHSCNAATLANISALMTGLTVLSSASLAPPGQRFLPLALDNEMLFQTLPHLMFPGTMVTRRPAVIFATIAVITNNIVLKERAAAYLESVRGTWYDPEIPENTTIGFVRLMLQYPAALTESELVAFTHVRNVHGFMINGRTTLDLVVPRHVCKTIAPDYKYKCVCCSHMRSFTLMTASGKCGLCEFDPEIGSKTPESAGAGKSFWYECRQCKAHYAIIDPDALHVEPKCHYCRECRPAPIITCCRCHGRFVNPSKKPTPGWYCPGCKENSTSQTEKVQTTIAKLFETNGPVVSDWIGLTVPPGVLNHSLFELASIVKRRAQWRPADVELTYKGKHVMNATEVLEHVQRWMESGRAEHADCMLCFENLHKTSVYPTCGRRGCESRACATCLDAWYGAMTPGGPLNPANMHCPFCKRFPAARILMKHNPRGCELIRRGVPEFDAAWLYAWCVQCYRPEQWMEKACGREGEEPTVTGFVCEGCRTATPEILVNARECPSCDVMTEKTMGCDHITCRNCSDHWCWRCGAGGFTGTSIYGHIYNCRGDGRVDRRPDALYADDLRDDYNSDEDW